MRRVKSKQINLFSLQSVSDNNNNIIESSDIDLEGNFKLIDEENILWDISINNDGQLLSTSQYNVSPNYLTFYVIDPMVTLPQGFRDRLVFVTTTNQTLTATFSDSRGEIFSKSVNGTTITLNIDNVAGFDESFYFDGRGDTLFGEERVARCDISFSAGISTVTDIQRGNGGGGGYNNTIGSWGGYVDLRETPSLTDFLWAKLTTDNFYAPIQATSSAPMTRIYVIGETYSVFDMSGIENIEGQILISGFTDVRMPPGNKNVCTAATTIQIDNNYSTTLDLRAFNNLTELTMDYSGGGLSPGAIQLEQILFPVGGVTMSNFEFGNSAMTDLDISNVVLSDRFVIRGSSVLEALSVTYSSASFDEFRVQSSPLSYTASWYFNTYFPNVLNRDNSYIIISSNGWSSTEVDNALIHLAAGVSGETSGGDYTGREIDYSTGNSARTTASDSAVAILTDKSITLT